MRLYLVRHAAAEDRGRWDGADADRPLTDKGAKAMRRAAAVLAKAGVHPDAIVSSPYARADATAAILAAELGLSDAPELDARLEPGFGMRALHALLAEHADAEELMVVGHEPDLSDAVAQLAGGARVEFRKGAVARVDLADAQAGEGALVWLAPPALLAP